MEIKEFTVKTAGAELAAAEWGDGPPLVLVHPFVFSKAYYTAAADVWGARYRCVAFDQRGHGHTQAETISLEAMADDIAAVLDSRGWAKAAVGGTSLGAATALVFALRHPGRVEKLIQDLPAFGPSSFRDRDRAEEMAKAFDREDFETATRRITEGMGPIRVKSWTDALEAEWKNYDRAVLGPKLAWGLRATIRWKIVDHWPADLARITAPTRVLGVQGDPIHPYAVAQTMVRTIPGARYVPRVTSLSPESVAHQWIEVLGE